MTKYTSNNHTRLHTRKQTSPGTRRKVIIHDLIFFVGTFAAAIIISGLLSTIHVGNNQFAVPVFILVVSLIARFTTGYIYGVVASLMGVFCVNYLFTYPYWVFDMTITGYPLTFAVMLLVSVFISTLTSQIKKQEILRMEAEMEKMRANLLRSVSHDLRTPLTSIVGASSVLLEDDDLSVHQRDDLLREINKDARWLARITENILSVTKFSGQKVSIRKEYEVVEEIVSSAIVKSRKSHPGVPISVSRPEEILLAPMDATLIEQVILNLFDNAVVHGIKTSQIHVSIYEKHNRIYISICDNGVGIPENVIPHLFDGRAYAFSPHSDDSRNMGIGLSVCGSIIQAHGGTISASNNKNGGASFVFWLPAEKGKDNESA